MATGEVRRPWYETGPELAEQIERDLREHYPTLHLELQGGNAEVRGTFPVFDEDGTELDRWQVSIKLPAGYPEDLPVVWETGGRILPSLHNHVVPSDGSACVLLPETRYKWFPLGAPFLDYLNVPMRSYFTNQSFRAHGGVWVHDDWDHGAFAAIDFYKELLESNEDIVGWRGVISMGLGIQGDQACPCGRRRPVQKCHPVLLDVQHNLGKRTAQLRMVQALEKKLRIQGDEALFDFLSALRREVKGHHNCPCGSGQRVRDCHPAIRELNGALPIELRAKRRRTR